jgi:exodeoxyribonuclease-3
MAPLWKLATFNVNGIRARLATVLNWVEAHQPDVLCLQEIKCEDRMFPAEPFLEAGYQVSVRGQKSFHGVAVLTRRPPVEICRAFEDGMPEEEARLLALLVDGIWVVNTYVPQGRDPGDPAFLEKLAFFERLLKWLDERFTADTPLVWAGDINVAPEPLDVFDPKRLEGQVGFHPAEKAALARNVAWGFTDLFRRHHPGVTQFTFWDYRLPRSFERNLGWRLDHILVTAPLAAASVTCAVDSALRAGEKPSDHCPVWAELDLALLDSP